jgi:YD repeat-containing protein
MRRRRARTLSAPMLAVLAMGMGDCDENTQLCGHTQEDPRGALIAGFACLGVDAADNKLPMASFTMTPNPVRSGGAVVFDASASSDPDGSITRYEWDLDPRVGERETERGVTIPTEFEVDNGAEPVLERQVFAGFTGRRVGLRVTDSSRETTVLYQRLDITSDPSVTAAFSVSPRPAFAGQPVQFDASASTGAFDYSWDFEGNGSFTEPSFVGTASHVYPMPGVRTVRLRVRGIDGNVVDAADMLDVRPVAGGSGADVSAISRAASRAAVRARGRRFSARLIGVSLPVDPDARPRAHANALTPPAAWLVRAPALTECVRSMGEDSLKS